MKKTRALKRRRMCTVRQGREYRKVASHRTPVRSLFKRFRIAHGCDDPRTLCGHRNMYISWFLIYYAHRAITNSGMCGTPSQSPTLLAILYFLNHPWAGLGIGRPACCRLTSEYIFIRLVGRSRILTYEPLIRTYM